MGALLGKYMRVSACVNNDEPFRAWCMALSAVHERQCWCCFTTPLQGALLYAHCHNLMTASPLPPIPHRQSCKASTHQHCRAEGQTTHARLPSLASQELRHRRRCTILQAQCTAHEMRNRCCSAVLALQNPAALNPRFIHADAAQQQPLICIPLLLLLLPPCPVTPHIGSWGEGAFLKPRLQWQGLGAHGRYRWVSVIINPGRHVTRRARRRPVACGAFGFGGCGKAFLLAFLCTERLLVQALCGCTRSCR